MWPNNNGFGNQGGYGGQGWNNQGTWNEGPQGAGFVNLGGGGMGGMGGGMGMGVNMGGMGMGGGMGGMGVSFNRWGNTGLNYQSMNGYTHIDYSSGWNPSYHDQLLRTNIDYVFQQYDFNFSGQLHGQEFFFAYRDLCLRMGLAPPMDYQSVWGAAMASDVNGNGQVSKMELFILFKKIQGINNSNNGWNM